MALPDFTTQDPATYKGNIDLEVANNQSDIADHESRIDYLEKPSAVRALRSGGQTISTSTFTTIIYNSEEIDSNGEFDPVTGIFTTKTGGFFMVTATASIANAYNAGDIMTLNLLEGGFVIATDSFEAQVAGTITAVLSVTGLMYLTSGGTSTCHAEVIHVTGTSKSVQGSDSTSFHLAQIGPAI